MGNCPSKRNKGRFQKYQNTKRVLWEPPIGENIRVQTSLQEEKRGKKNLHPANFQTGQGRKVGKRVKGSVNKPQSTGEQVSLTFWGRGGGVGRTATNRDKGGEEENSHTKEEKGKPEKKKCG